MTFRILAIVVLTLYAGAPFAAEGAPPAGAGFLVKFNNADVYEEFPIVRFRSVRTEPLTP